MRSTSSSRQTTRSSRFRVSNVQRFRGGLVFKAHRLVYHSTLGLRVIKKKKACQGSGTKSTTWSSSSRQTTPSSRLGAYELVQGGPFDGGGWRVENVRCTVYGVRVQGAGCRVQGVLWMTPSFASPQTTRSPRLGLRLLSIHLQGGSA